MNFKEVQTEIAIYFQREYTNLIRFLRARINDLSEIDGFTFRELAEVWDQPIGTLLARKHRATGALRKALQELIQDGLE